MSSTDQSPFEGKGPYLSADSPFIVHKADGEPLSIRHPDGDIGVVVAVSHDDSPHDYQSFAAMTAGAFEVGNAIFTVLPGEATADIIASDAGLTFIAEGCLAGQGYSADPFTTPITERIDSLIGDEGVYLLIHSQKTLSKRDLEDLSRVSDAEALEAWIFDGREDAGSPIVCWFLRGSHFWTPDDWETWQRRQGA